MDNALFYAIKTSIPIVFFVFLYWLILKDEKYFHLNRAFLLLGLVAGFTFPLLKFPNVGIASQVTGVAELLPLTISAEQIEVHSGNSYSVFKLLSIIYILGTVVFATRFLFRLMQILFLTLRHSGVKVNGFQTVYVKGNQTPFTFFNFLFLPLNQKGKRPEEVVLEHEWVHFSQMHTIDNLLVELAIVFQWFNPAIWLCKPFMQSVHEYTADRKVLEKGYNKFEYQKLMVETSTGMKVAGISSHFNATLLKKRITMMSNYKSNKLSVLKYVLILPLFVLGLLMFAPGSISVAQSEHSDKVFTEVDKRAEYPGGFNQARVFVAENVRYPQSARQAGIEARVFVQFTVDENGKVKDVVVVHTNLQEADKENEVVVVGYKENTTKVDKEQAIVDLEEEAVRVISLLNDFTPGEKDGEKVKTQFTFPINFALN